MENNRSFMLRAAALAEQARGWTAPNPTVGAVLVRDGQIVAEGWHKRYGGPHAEVEVLADARSKGIEPADCELYVTLEPCNHHGKTPPCTEAILRAGVKRVMVGARDPNPDVKGGGVDYLRANGVRVDVGLAETVCRDLISDFTVWKSTLFPYVYLKLATTLDGKIASRSGQAERVTGVQAKEVVHGLRGRVDAVLIGGGTLRADNPQLTPRQPQAEGERKDPWAVVVTSRLPAASADLFLLRKRPERTVFLTTGAAAASDDAQMLMDLGCKVWGLSRAGRGEGLSLSEGLRRLRKELGCHYLLCEGGGSLAWSLADKDLVHELWMLLAPRVLGDDGGKSAFAGRGPAAMAEAKEFRLRAFSRVGDDLLAIYKQDGGRD